MEYLEGETLNDRLTRGALPAADVIPVPHMPVAISSLLADSLSIVRENAAAHRIRLEVDAAEELGWIQADGRKIKQIVYNLLSNAVKFTGEGGLVAVRVSHVSRAEVGELSGSWTGRSFPLADSAFTKFLRIGVTDSGVGISGDGLDALFRPFSQVDGSLARKFEGTGLGLAMVKLLVELHGGAVAVESAVGEGSRFTIWLPLRAPEEEALTSAPASPGIEALAHAHRAGGRGRLQIRRTDPTVPRSGGVQGAACRFG